MFFFMLAVGSVDSTCSSAALIDKTVLVEQYSYSGGYVSLIYNLKSGLSTSSLYYFIRLYNGSVYTSAIMKETSSGAVAWHKQFSIYPTYKNFHVANNEQYV